MEKLASNTMETKTPGLWWKVLCAFLMVYTVVGGFFGKAPSLPILETSIRNLYFHVPLWFAMLLLMGASAWYAIKALREGGNPQKDLAKLEGFDLLSNAQAQVGFYFGIVGLITGMIWAKYTWGDWWSADPKQNGTAVCLLLYAAYFILRSSISDRDSRLKVSAVFNIFCFSMVIPLLYILPRLRDSLHPGNGGNPGFNAYDLDSNLRMVFYPAVLGYILLAFWIASIQYRIEQKRQLSIQ